MRPNAFLGPLGAACLLLAALAVPSAAWPAGRPETVVLDACGPLAVEPGLAEPWPAGRAARSGATVSPTDKGLGCRFTVAGKPAGAPVLVEARLTRPTPGGGQAVSRWFVPARRGEPAVAAYAFSPSDPAAPGLWTLELFAGDARLAGQAFTVPGAVGASASVSAEAPAPSAAMPAAPTPAGPPAPGPEAPSQAVSAPPAAPVPAMPPESRDSGLGPAPEAPTGREPAQDVGQASPAAPTETPAAAPVPEAALPRAGSPSPASPSAVPAAPADSIPAAMLPASVASQRPAADPAPTPKKAGAPPAIGRAHV